MTGSTDRLNIFSSHTSIQFQYYLNNIGTFSVTWLNHVNMAMVTVSMNTMYLLMISI